MWFLEWARPSWAAWATAAGAALGSGGARHVADEQTGQIAQAWRESNVSTNAFALDPEKLRQLAMQNMYGGAQQNPMQQFGQAAQGPSTAGAMQVDPNSAPSNFSTTVTASPMGPAPTTRLRTSPPSRPTPARSARACRAGRLSPCPMYLRPATPRGLMSSAAESLSVL
jgi:hypothetical protein